MNFYLILLLIYLIHDKIFLICYYAFKFFFSISNIIENFLLRSLYLATT